jgi:predicted dehydrogenase
MQPEAVRVAVVGCGFQGRLHIECLRRIPDATVVAVCDRDKDRLSSVTEDLGVAHGFSDHRTLLARQPVDLVTVCTMPDSHCEIALDALAAGAAVLCEKPMAVDLDAAKMMAAAARSAGRPLSVGCNLRYSSAAEAIRTFVLGGQLGAPVCARGSMLETEIPWWGPHHVKSISGGGAIASTGVHMIDLLMWLAGNPRPLSATASVARLFPSKRGESAPSRLEAERYDVEDLAFAHVRFESGFWMTIESSWTWDAPGSECRFDLVGERGHASAEPLRLSAERSGRIVDLTDGVTGNLDFPDSVQRELADVVAAIRDDRSPLVTAEQALEVQAVMDAIYRSAASGTEVAVEQTRDGDLDDHADTPWQPATGRRGR